MTWRFWRRKAVEPRITLRELRKQEIVEWDRQFAMLTGYISKEARLSADFADDLVRAIRFQMLHAQKASCEFCSKPIVTEVDGFTRSRIMAHEGFAVRISEDSLRHDIDALWKAKDDLCLKAHAA